MEPARDDDPAPDLLQILGKSLNRAILEALDSGPLTLVALAGRVERSKTQVCTYAAELRRCGLVRRVRRGRRAWYARTRHDLSRVFLEVRRIEQGLASSKAGRRPPRE